MRVFAYCAGEFVEAARRASGVAPLVCPPMAESAFAPEMLEGYDLIYLDLHGEPWGARLYGDHHTAALATWQAREADLTGAVVFAVSCYMADEGSPMLQAFLDAGARYVIAGEGRNWAASKAVTGAHLLGMRFRQLMAWGMEPLAALRLAKRWVALAALLAWGLGRSGGGEAERDALEFRAYTRRSV